jgi:hypothetical protein
MLVIGETFFSAVTIALNFLLEDKFLTKTMSPTFPSERASPYVTMVSPADPDTINMVSLLFTALLANIC